MTDDNNTLRAVFLAALMVLWVFAGTVAFAGGAAAIENGTIEDGSISLSSTTTGASSVNYNGTYNTSSGASGEVGGVAMVLTDGSGGTAGGAIPTGLGTGDVALEMGGNAVGLEDVVVADLDNDGVNDSVFLDLDGPVTPGGDNVTTVNITGVDNPTVEGTYTAELRSYEGDNPFQSSYESTTADYTISGAPDGDDGEREVDADFAGGSTRWKGQILHFDADLTCSTSTDDIDPDSYQLRYYDTSEPDAQGALIREITLNGSTAAQIPTENVADNEQVVVTAVDPEDDTRKIVDVNSNGEQTAECFDPDGDDTVNSNDWVEIVPQTLDAEFAEDSVRANEDATLELDSNRNDYDVYVDSDDFTTGELEGVITNSTNTDDVNVNRAPSSSSVIVENLDSDDTIVFNFDATGNYSFTLSPTDTIPSDDASIQVIDEQVADANFASDTGAFSVKRGDIQSPEGHGDATISVDSTDLDYVVVTVGDETRNNYETDILAAPDSDGNVDIRMNTFLAGQLDAQNESRAFEAINDGEVLGVDRSSQKLTGVLDEGQYDLTLETRDGAELDGGVMNIRESSYNELNQYRHPDTALSNADDISELANNSDLTESELITLSDRSRSDVQRDLLVHEIDISGIYGVFDAIRNNTGAGESLDTADGNSILDSAQSADVELGPEYNDEILDVSLVQTNFKQNREPKAEGYQDSEVSDPGFEFVIDEDNETLYLVTDVRDIELSREIANGGQETGLQATNEEDYTFSFEVGPGYNETFEGGIDQYKPEGNTTTTVNLADRTAEFDEQGADRVRVNNEANQTISGETNVAPGTVITIAVDSSSRTRRADDNETEELAPVFQRATAVVQDDGTFADDSFDFSDNEVGRTFVVTGQNAGLLDAAEKPGIVVEGTPASVALSDIVVPVDQDELSTITVDSAYLPQGGFVTIHDGSFNDGATFDSVRGTSDYIEADTEVSDVEVTLDSPYTEDGTAIAMAHQDTNNNEAYDFVSSEGDADGAYTVDDGAVIASASVTFETPTPTPTASPTASPTESPTESPTASPTSDQPGFGAALALIALIGAALLAARRRDF